VGRIGRRFPALTLVPNPDTITGLANCSPTSPGPGREEVQRRQRARAPAIRSHPTPRTIKSTSRSRAQPLRRAWPGFVRTAAAPTRSAASRSLGSSARIR